MIRVLPTSMQRTYDKAMTGKCRPAAVKAFCSECCGYDRNAVTLCTDPGCPLYQYRPFRDSASVRKAKQEEAEEKTRILAEAASEGRKKRA